jgi:hypothetical protein
MLLWVALAAVLLSVPSTVAASDGLGATPAGGIAAPEQASPHEAPPADAPRLEPTTKVPAPPATFATYDGGWIRFAYHPSVRERVQRLMAVADEAREELSSRLGQSVLSQVNVYVARTAGEMTTLAPPGAPYPKYASGVAYSDIKLVLLMASPVQANDHFDLLEVFKHELAHIALADAVKRPIPRWFNEGFAVMASDEGSFVRLQTLWTATVADNLIDLRELERSFPSDGSAVDLAYAEAADVVRFLVRRQDRHRFRAFIEEYRNGSTFDTALVDAYGVDRASLEQEWREEVAKRYTFWPVLFSGSFVWAGAIGLFVWGYRKRKRRSQATLERWEREEALEAARRVTPEPAREPPRVHIVLARPAAPAGAEDPLPRVDPGVPKVEHEGQWHTLH